MSPISEKALSNYMSWALNKCLLNEWINKVTYNQNNHECIVLCIYSIYIFIIQLSELLNRRTKSVLFWWMSSILIHAFLEIVDLRENTFISASGRNKYTLVHVYTHTVHPLFVCMCVSFVYEMLDLLNMNQWSMITSLQNLRKLWRLTWIILTLMKMK